MPVSRDAVAILVLFNGLSLLAIIVGFLWIKLDRVARNVAAALKVEEKEMSQLSDAIAAANAAADDAITRVNADVADLKQQIADLQAQIDAGGATPDDLSNLASLQAKLAALDPAQPATTADIPPTTGG
jgi:uncharacterized protein YoxC